MVQWEEDVTATSASLNVEERELMALLGAHIHRDLPGSGIRMAIGRRIPQSVRPTVRVVATNFISALQRRIAKRLAPPYTLRILQQPHTGPAAAPNRGVAQARGSLVLFLDGDVVPRPELIALHIVTHEAEPDAVVIGPMSSPEDWPRPPWIRWEEDKLQAQYRAMLDGEYACTARQFYTANASLTRARFIEAGGFDCAFKRAEDVELGYRLRDHGARFVIQLRAEVLHYASRSFEVWCRKPYQYGRYDVIMHRAKGHEAFPLATKEFHGRNLLNRLLARLCVGRGLLVRGTVAALGGVARTAHCLGARRLASFALSGIFQPSVLAGRM
jgi:GT2 family glycosyltransferase